MADFFIRRPIVAMVIAILTVIVGLISLKRLPIAEYPPVSPTMIQVTTTYRGAAAEAVKAGIRTIIDAETEILSDDAIAAMLKQKGFDVARRTVVKYREAMGIGSSIQRRRQRKIGG